MTENTIDETVDEQETSDNQPEGSDLESHPSTPDEDAESFPRDYVEKLRDENAKYRQRAKDRDEIAARLHTALVAATGRLADPTDLDFNDEHLSDPEALSAAVESLLEAKPHLASRKPSGDIGQGASVSSDTFSLSGLLKTNAS